MIGGTGRTGKTGVVGTIGKIGKVGAAVAVLLLLVGAGTPRSAAGAGKAENWAKGFRGIAWGTSLKEAREGMPDLVQETFGAGGEPDHFVRERSAEDPLIEGIRFDRIEYHFRKGTFVGVVATARTGSYKLYYDMLREKISDREGKPDEEAEGRSLWKVKGTRVELLRRLHSVWLRVVREPSDR